MSNSYIRIIGDELWLDGQKVGTLHTEGVTASVAAAVRTHLTKTLADEPVRKWRP